MPIDKRFYNQAGYTVPIFFHAMNKTITSPHLNEEFSLKELKEAIFGYLEDYRVVITYKEDSWSLELLTDEKMPRIGRLEKITFFKIKRAQEKI